MAKVTQPVTRPLTWPLTIPGDSPLLGILGDIGPRPPISVLFLGQSEMEYLFNAGAFYRQIAQPIPGDGNLVVITQGAVDAVPVKTIVNPTTVAAGSVNPAQAALSAFLDFARPGRTFVVIDGAVAGTGRYELVDDADADRKWSDLIAAIDLAEGEFGPVNAVIEMWFANDAGSYPTFKESFWPFYFGVTHEGVTFVLGNPNPDAQNPTPVFDHCLWDADAATSAKGRGIFARDTTEWRILTPFPQWSGVPDSTVPEAEAGNFTDAGTNMNEPTRATMMGWAADSIAQTVNLRVGPSAHLCRFGNGSSLIHPDVDTADGQVLAMWPFAVELLRLAGTTVSEPVIESVEVGSAGAYVDVVVDLPNGGTLTTLRAFRSASAPGVEPPHYQAVTGFEIERGSTRHPVYKTSETSYGADYRGTVTIVDSGSGTPRKGRVRITPTNAFDSTCSVSYLRGTAVAATLQPRDVDAQLYLNMLIEHIPALYDDAALYPFEGIPVRPYQSEIAITVPDVTAPTVSSFSPVDGATDVAVDATLTVTFNEEVQAGTGSIDLYETTGDVLVESFDVTTDVNIVGAAVSFTPTTDLDPEVDYYVQIDATAIEDLSGNAYAGIADETTWNFTTASASAPYATTVSGGPYFVDPANVPASTTVIEYNLKVYIPSSALANGVVYNLATQESTGCDLAVAVSGGGVPTWRVIAEDGDGTAIIASGGNGATGVTVPVDQWITVNLVIDAVAGTAEIEVNGSSVWSLSGLTFSPASFQSVREISFLGTTAGANLAPIGTRFEYLEAYFTTSGSRTLRKRIAGDAATVNADAWKAGSNAV